MPTKPSPAAGPSRKVEATMAGDDEVTALRAEVQRLRDLVGPSEESYVKLRLDVLGARDAAMGAIAETGQLKGRCAALEAQVARLTRDQIWFRDQVLLRLRDARHRATPTMSRVVSRLSR